MNGINVNPMANEPMNPASVENNAAPIAENPAPKKVNRRGIGSARGTSRLKFTHELAKQNGLFLGHLDSVTVSDITIGEDKTGMPSFNGMNIPKLTLTFASNEDDVNKRRYVTLTFTAVESNVNTIPDGKESWKVDSVFDWLKHIMSVYVLKGRDFTEEEEEMMSLSYTDFDENGDYVPVDTEAVVESWRKVFMGFEYLMNHGKDGGTAYYKDNKGRDITVWLKLLRYIKSKKGWQPINNGDLAFPAFVGEGCIEIFKQNTPASIRVDAVKEAIIPMNVEKPKAPNMPAPGAMPGFGAPAFGAPAMGGVPVGDPMMANPGFGGFGQGLAAEAATDMPFGD